MINWTREEFVVCPKGHINLVEKGERPKFCYECGMEIDYSPEAQNIKTCKRCGRPISKDLDRIKNGFTEEYKDTGLCINCWVKSNAPMLNVLKARALEHAL